MSKLIKYDMKAREAMLNGVRTLAKSVVVTLGPKGRNVIIEKSWGAPTITKDGVTVAKEIDLEDKFENMGAQMVKEVASKTSDMAGDGTTTATVLARAIYEEGQKLVAAGNNPMAIKRGIDKAVEVAVKELHKIVRSLEKKGYSIGGKKYKKTPKGYDPNTLYPGYLLYEGIYAWYEGSNLKEIGNGEAISAIFKIFKDMLPLHKWLVKNIL